MFTRGKKQKKSEQNYYIINTVNNLNLVIKPGESFPKAKYSVVYTELPMGLKYHFSQIHFHS